jgi:GNAT superfamily N-acetyltransferase
MAALLWPDEDDYGSDDELVLVHERPSGGLGGFASVSIRPRADACESEPCAYLEGWWVDADLRRQGVGRALVAAAERWAIERGFGELGSDALLENTDSAAAHLALGFERVEQIQTFRKKLSSAPIRAVPEQGFEGGCDCRRVRYRMTSEPMFVHCCHCRWCQRETGASFALNAMIEIARLSFLAALPIRVHTPSASGKGQDIFRCPSCRVALYSHYAGAGERVAFVRVGTLDQPDRFPPDVHIFTSTKQPWVVLPAGVPAFAEYYDREKVWPKDKLERRRIVLGL